MKTTTFLADKPTGRDTSRGAALTIQQLQRDDNVWLSQLSADYFDLILFDEAHHNVAESWETLRSAAVRHGGYVRHHLPFRASRCTRTDGW